MRPLSSLHYLLTGSEQLPPLTNAVAVHGQNRNSISVAADSSILSLLMSCGLELPLSSIWTPIPDVDLVITELAFFPLWKMPYGDFTGYNRLSNFRLTCKLFFQSFKNLN